jgi:phenylacetate-CoA ligase
VQERGAELRSAQKIAGQLAPTSGTAGVPTTVMRGHLSWAHVHANKFRQWRWHGLEVGQRYAYFWGLSQDPKDRREAEAKDWIFNRERCSAFALGPESARRFYERMIDQPARFAYGYPSSIMQFADELAAQKLDARRLGWKAAVTTSEVVLPEWRERIEQILGCRVADNYGCAETGDAGIECERSGMHLPVESIAVDLLPGTEGLPEMLLTDLFNLAQPMIKYRVGDLLDPAPSDATCPCGRGLPLLGRPIGRAGDNLTLPDGRQVNCHTTTYLFKRHGKSGAVREYQFVQFPEGRIELRIHPGPSWSDDTQRQLGAEARAAFGWPVEIKLVERFERRGRGKHRDFVRAEDLERV